MVQRNCHPAFLNVFTEDSNGKVKLVNDDSVRIKIGGRRFEIMARDIYNE